MPKGYKTVVEPIENERKDGIFLTSAQLSEVGLIVGGKIFKTSDEFMKFVKDNYKLTVNGIEVSLCAEDANALKDQHASYPAMPFEDYVAIQINEALAQFLWGSTRGLL